MSYDLPYRRLFLEDAISKEKTGVSPLKENQRLARYYTWVKRLTTISFLSTATLGYLAVNKRYTGRRTYLIGFAGSLVVFFLFRNWLGSVANKCLDQWKCDVDKFSEYAWFYKNAMLDHDNYYEDQRRNH